MQVLIFPELGFKPPIHATYWCPPPQKVDRSSPKYLKTSYAPFSQLHSNYTNYTRTSPAVKTLLAIILLLSDINECATDNGGCDTNAICVNTIGSYLCFCKEGYAGGANDYCYGTDTHCDS